jgi:hypothetical protein
MTTESRRYRVEVVGQARDQLELITTIAEQRGLRKLLRDVLQATLSNLETRPSEWGDPYINYRGLNAVGYEVTLVTSRLRIAYTVHNTQPLVLISRIIPLSDSPFHFPQ